MLRSPVSWMRTFPPELLPRSLFRDSPKKPPDWALRAPRVRGKTRQLCGCRALHGVLAWPSTRTLASDDRAALNDLATPNTPRLFAFQRRGEALAADRAIRAQRLCALEVKRGFGEPQVGVIDMTRHRQHRSLTACLRFKALRASAHRRRHGYSLCFLVVVSSAICLSMDP